jgi:uncharacterized protein
MTAPPDPVDAPSAPFRQRFPWIGGDLQTLRDYLVQPDERVPAAATETLTFAMPDGSGDALIGVWDRPLQPVPDLPLAVLIHGLTGCADSFYVRRSARGFLQAGYPTLRLNLRGAGAGRRLARQQYHSGRSEDLAAVLDALDAPHGVVLVGWSLGANMLLKGVAELGSDRRVRGAVAVSAPIDLMMTARRFTAPRNAIYQHWLLARMKEDMAAGPDGLSARDRGRLAAVRTVIEFDDAFTGPNNGFANAADYYARCSAKRYLAAIRVPTLVIHALDDPWIPAEMYRTVDWSALPTVTDRLTRHGGHVGFHDPDGVWSDRVALRFLATV